MGTNAFPRQVPLTQLRKLEGNLPPSLQELTLKLLDFDNPRSVRPKFVNKGVYPKRWDHGMMSLMKPKQMEENVLEVKEIY